MEHRVDPLTVVEVEVPPLQVLVDVGEVHVRASDEVRVAEGGVAERLEVRDLRRPEPGLHGRRKAEEELCRGRHELRAADLRGGRDLTRKALCSVEAAADDTGA